MNKIKYINIENKDKEIDLDLIKEDDDIYQFLKDIGVDGNALNNVLKTPFNKRAINEQALVFVICYFFDKYTKLYKETTSSKTMNKPPKQVNNTYTRIGGEFQGDIQL